MLRYFFFSSYSPHPYLHSFPTRRSSDLVAFLTGWIAGNYGLRPYPFYIGIGLSLVGLVSSWLFVKDTAHHVKLDRSEEHTSELQSRRDLVCRLLLEKKNKRTW